MNLKKRRIKKSAVFFKKDETFFDKFRLNNTGKRLGARIKELLNNL
jgi:hypothetical protein